MYNSISLPYIRDEANALLTIMELHHLANKNHMALAWEEAKELLELVKQENKKRALTGTKLEKLIEKISYDNSFGRMLTCDEVKDLSMNPNQVLIDD